MFLSLYITNHLQTRNLLAIQLVSTFCDVENGAGGETRTPNRPITNRVLYQLSHTSTVGRFNRNLPTVNRPSYLEARSILFP